MTGVAAPVLAIVDELVRAWNSRESENFAGLFAETAVYRTGCGTLLMGRSEIDHLVDGRGICLTEEVKIEFDAVHAVVRLSWREVGGDRSGASAPTLALTIEGRWEIMSCRTTLHG